MTGEPSCKDEARIGQKNGVVRQWTKTGTRPRQPADQRYENAYLFGAICPAHGKGAAIVSPWANTEAMQLHLDEISRSVAPGAQAVLIMDRAGWHTTNVLAVPKNITPILLPSYSPELNPVENIWQYIRATGARKEAKIIIERWRRHYNTVRPHSSLGYKPPAPEALQWPPAQPGPATPATPAIAPRPIMN